MVTHSGAGRGTNARFGGAFPTLRRSPGCGSGARLGGAGAEDLALGPVRGQRRGPGEGLGRLRVPAGPGEKVTTNGGDQVRTGKRVVVGDVVEHGHAFLWVVGAPVRDGAV